MPTKDITQTNLASSVNDSAEFLAVQTETVEGQQKQVLQKAPFEKVVDALLGETFGNKIVQTSPRTLAESEKKVARSNIDAASGVDMDACKERVTDFGNRVPVLEHETSVIEKRVSNLENSVFLNAFVTDTGKEEIKAVPDNACPYAILEGISGNTERIGDELVDSTIKAVKIVGKNKVVYPFEYGNTTHQNVSWTVNADGSVTANGTAEGNNSYYRFADDILLKKGTYYFSGCPSGGSYSTYYQYVYNTDTETAICVEHGQGASFTIDRDTVVKVIGSVVAGQSVSNLVFKPMVSLGSERKEFAIYNESIVAIPDEILALEGIGQGISFVRNEVDLISGIYRRALKTICFDGSEAWFDYQTPRQDEIKVYVVNLKDRMLGYKSSICSHFANESRSWDTGDNRVYSDHDTAKNVYFCSDMQTIEEFKEWLKQQYDAGTPVTLTYAIERPEDIPLPLVDNYIGPVENGGTIEFVTTNRRPVMSRITYQIGAQS